VVLCPSIIDAGLSSSVLGEEHRTLNPGLLPSNDLIRLQFESSIGICVPNLVPDGLHQARQWPQVEDGGPELRDPTWAPRSLPRRPPASRGRPWGSDWEVLSTAAIEVTGGS